MEKRKNKGIYKLKLSIDQVGFNESVQKNVLILTILLLIMSCAQLSTQHNGAAFILSVVWL